MIFDHHAPTFLLSITFIACLWASADRSAYPPEAMVIQRSRNRNQKHEHDARA
jgi:hypothetical protein